MKTLILLLFYSCIVTAFSFPITPDPDLSRGQYCTTSDKDFDHFRYSERIPYCRRNVRSSEKDKICERDGVYSRKGYIVDHIIPLSLGGNNSWENLWCQHKSINTSRMEYYYYRLVRDGKMKRDTAVKALLRCKFSRDCGEWFN